MTRNVDEMNLQARKRMKLVCLLFKMESTLESSHICTLRFVQLTWLNLNKQTRLRAFSINLHQYIGIWFFHPWILITSKWFSGNSHLAVISSPPSAAYMRQWTGSAFVQIMAYRLFGAKPLSKRITGSLSIGPLGTDNGLPHIWCQAII